MEYFKWFTEKAYPQAYKSTPYSLVLGQIKKKPSVFF